MARPPSAPNGLGMSRPGLDPATRPPAALVRPLRVLAVEAGSDHAARLGASLEEAANEVEIRGHATLAAARSDLRSGEFDCVLLDISGRDANGLESLAEVRRLAPESQSRCRPRYFRGRGTGSAGRTRGRAGLPGRQGGRRQPARAEHPVRDRAHAERARACPPRLLRPPHSPPQPQAPSRSPRSCARRRGALGAARGLALPGPGPLQAGQREPGTRGRRRPAEAGRPKAHRARAAERHRGSPRRRRVHGPVPGPGRRARGRAGRGAIERRAGRGAPGRGVRALRGSEHRYRLLAIAVAAPRP